MEMERLVMSGKCRFYMNNPLDPTVRMYLPDKYAVEIEKEKDFGIVIDTIVNRMEEIYKARNITVKPDTQDIIISNESMGEDPYISQFIIHLTAVYKCMEWFECDGLDGFNNTYNIDLIFENPLNFDDKIAGLVAKIYVPVTDTFTDEKEYYIPSHKADNEDELRRLKFITYLLHQPSAYYVLVTGTPDKE